MDFSNVILEIMIISLAVIAIAKDGRKLANKSNERFDTIDKNLEYIKSMLSTKNPSTHLYEVVPSKSYVVVIEDAEEGAVRDTESNIITDYFKERGAEVMVIFTKN